MISPVSRPGAAGRRAAVALIVLATTLLSPVAQAQAPGGGDPVLKLYPHANGDHIVFVARENLWQAPRAGGVATPLTSGVTRPVMPRYSPDGAWLAFSAKKGGHQDVYVMPAGGGEAKRLTFNPNSGRDQDDLVVTWSPDSREIIFGSQIGAWNGKNYRLFAVPVTGGLPRPLPMEHAGLLSYAGDARHVVYVQSMNDFDSRKRYDGGQAQDIYSFNLDTRASRRITDWKGNDTAPMWFERKIYFLSDRDAKRRANLWVADEVTGKSRQITFFSDYDIDFPSLGGRQITFQQGGKLYALELPTERLHEIVVTMPADAGAPTREVEAALYIRDHDATGAAVYALSPDGTQAVLSARGDLFSIETRAAGRVNLTASSGADEEHPAFSPDGKTLAYITDANGEQQLAVRPAQGGAQRILTRFKQGYLYTPVWSPDGRSLAVADADKRLWLVSLADGAARDIAHDIHRRIDDAAFSPDSRWLAYSLQGENQQRGIHLYDIAAGQDHLVSSAMNNDSEPVFSDDGNYLYFISSRHEFPVTSSSEEAFATVDADGVYVTTLRSDTPSAVAASRAGGPVAERVAASSMPAPLRIDLDGLMRRTVPLPVAPGTFSSLAVRGDLVFYQSQPIAMVGGELPGQENALHVHDMRLGADRVLLQGFDNATLSGDGNWVMATQGKDWKLLASAPPAATTSITTATTVMQLKGMTTMVDTRREWAAMFDRVWRLDRDFYLSPTMNGIDWPAVRASYARLVPLLGSRDDLNYLIGQLQGELATSHMFFGGGDFGPSTPRAATPRLGADYQLDEASGRYRLGRIYPGDNSRPELRSPLTEAGLGVREGEFLLAVNGKPLVAPQTPDGLLEGMTGKLDLLVAASLDAAPRHVVVTPVGREFALREEFMIEQNRAKVERLSKGRVAYLYLADFHQHGAEQFVRQFYPQMGKQALIIDVRGNAGGYTSQQILARLRRTIAGLYANRGGGRETLPAQLIAGPKVTLMNQFTSSDGDQFAYYFREFGLGKIIGKRSWGGVRGVTSTLDLADGGYLYVPKDALFSPKGKWIIENYGTAPDIEVDDVPGESLAGRDAQLDTAIGMMIDALDRHPTVLPAAPPALPAYPEASKVPGPSF